MFESEKTRLVRGEEFHKTYFQGNVLDIGCGFDLVVEGATPFDKEHGDANYMLNYFPPESFDTVHSSHTLEHLHRPIEALQEWWQLVRPGGYLIVIVPDEDLYEQGVWPSRFNRDHKFTFRLNDHSSWSPVSINLLSLAQQLPQGKVLNCELQDQGYNYAMRNMAPSSNWDKFTQFSMMEFIENLNKRELVTLPLLEEVNNLFFSMGAAVDQTLVGALAQIQVVVQKSC